MEDLGDKTLLERNLQMRLEDFSSLLSSRTSRGDVITTKRSQNATQPGCFSAWYSLLSISMLKAFALLGF